MKDRLVGMIVLMCAALMYLSRPDEVEEALHKAFGIRTLARERNHGAE